jgi:hypothetical protein
VLGDQVLVAAQLHVEPQIVGERREPVEQRASDAVLVGDVPLLAEDQEVDLD